MKRCYLLLLLVLLFSSLSSMDIPYSDKAVMEDANLIDNFVRIDPDDSHVETLATKAWVWQEENKLMIHFSCVIGENFQQGYPASRDSGIRADYLRVQLITLPDANYAYLFGAYPQGHLVDGIRKDDMSVDYQWDSDYSYESAYNDSLWTVTFSIPMGSLRFKQELHYTWGLILSRYHGSSKEFFSSPYANTDSKLEYFTKVLRIVLHEKISRELDLKIKPYFVKSYDLRHKTDSFDSNMLGMDIAFNPAQQTKVKLSFNPDFSDVPPDDAQDIYNNDTPAIYSENRFFFVEDLDTFGLSRSVFYSRNIIKPTFAYKATGNIGKTKWGILGARDEKVVQNGEVLNYDDYYQVLSIIPSYSIFTMGNALISRMNKGYYNHAYFGNYNVKIAKYLSLNTEFTQSITKTEGVADDEVFKGFQVFAEMNYSPENFDNYIYYQKVSKDIFLDAGYLYNKDRQTYGISMDWDSNPGYGFIKKKQSFLNLDFCDWYKGGYTYKEYSVYGNVGIDFKPGITFSLNSTYGTVHDGLWHKHNFYGLRGSSSLSDKNWARVTLAISYADELIYRLNKTYAKLGLEAYVSGDIAQRYSYTINWQLNDYGYPKDNVVDNGNGPVNVALDDRYSLINASLNYTPNLKLRFTTGLNYSSYESQGVYSKLNYYANLRYEFKRDYYIYAGYKSAQTQDEASTNSDYFGHFMKNSASIYFKVSVSL